VAAVTYGAEYLPANHFDTYFTAVQENGERILDKAVSLARKTVANVDPAMVRVRSRSYRCAPRERVAMKADGRLDVPLGEPQARAARLDSPYPPPSSVIRRHRLRCRQTDVLRCGSNTHNNAFTRNGSNRRYKSRPPLTQVNARGARRRHR